MTRGTRLCADNARGEMPMATTRVQLQLPEKAMTRLRSLKEETEAASYAEVIKSALIYYEIAMKKKSK
jgi:hypothetical protein